MIPMRAAHLSLTACRGSVTTSFANRLTETRRSSRTRRRDAGRRRRRRGGRRLVAPVLGRRDAMPGDQTLMRVSWLLSNASGFRWRSC